MLLEYSIRGTLIVPEGTTLNEAETRIILPTGESVAIFEAVELEETRDLNELERNELGIFSTSNFDREMELCPES